MGWKWVSGILVPLAAASAVFFAPLGRVQADLISTAPVSETATANAPEQKHETVAQGLKSAGLTTLEVEQRMGLLNQEDISVAAANPSQIQMAGSHLAVIALGCLILIAILYISFG